MRRCSAGLTEPGTGSSRAGMERGRGVEGSDWACPGLENRPAIRGEAKAMRRDSRGVGCCTGGLLRASSSEVSKEMFAFPL